MFWLQEDGTICFDPQIACLRVPVGAHTLTFWLQNKEAPVVVDIVVDHEGRMPRVKPRPDLYILGRGDHHYNRLKEALDLVVDDLPPSSKPTIRQRFWAALARLGISDWKRFNYSEADQTKLALDLR